jgi:branched-chain amino acid transport system ATP-binding protein
MTAPVLVADDISVAYGEAVALSDVSMSLDAGACIAVIGPNGAGKTTLAGALTGFLKPKAGRVLFDDVDVANVSTHKLPHKGLVYVPEGGGIFTGLSVADNVRMGLRRLKSASERTAAEHRAYEQFPALANRRHQRAGSLSGGEQRMLALTHILSAPPRVLVIDEPSLGLAPKIVHDVYELLAQARESGVSIILIEQFVGKALEFSDQAYVLQQGRVKWSGPARDAHDVVHDGYMPSVEVEEQ